MTAVLIAIAGGIGALVRAEVAIHMPRPYGTFLVNILGAAMLGALVGAGDAVTPATMKVLGVGFAGGLTTFSTWMVESAAESPTRRTIALAVPLTVGVFVAVAARAAARAVAG
jgi:CrcB protein